MSTYQVDTLKSHSPWNEDAEMSQKLQKGVLLQLRRKHTDRAHLLKTPWHCRPVLLRSKFTCHKSFKQWHRGNLLDPVSAPAQITVLAGMDGRAIAKRTWRYGAYQRPIWLTLLLFDSLLLSPLCLSFILLQIVFGGKSSTCACSSGLVSEIQERPELVVPSINDAAKSRSNAYNLFRKKY